MRLALRELRRRPGRFTVVGGALTLLVLLLLFLGALLDGLFLGSTGAIRAQDADVLVYSDDARESFLRSSLTEVDRDEIVALQGVEAAGGIGFTLLGVEIPGEDELADGAIAGYELATDVLPQPPAPGTAHADRRLEAFGAELGDVVRIGPREVEIEIVGWVEDTTYLQQNSLWVDLDTWRAVQNANRPDAIVAGDEFQAISVVATPGTDVETLIATVEANVAGTDALTENDAVFAVPGISEQQVTFNSIIAVTLFVVGLVVALFFALLTLERVSLYAVLKAIGASNRTLAAGLVTQAVAVAVGAFICGALLAWLLSLVIPPTVPVQFQMGRAFFFLLAVVATAIAGGVVSLRRVIKVDPASAIGAGV
ncbi:MAG: ABC transporter permease [Acidimicrobiales bacterium]